MRIYKERQIHTKTSSRPIKMQGGWCNPHTNPTRYNNYYLLTEFAIRTVRY